MIPPLTTGNGRRPRIPSPFPDPPGAKPWMLIPLVIVLLALVLLNGQKPASSFAGLRLQQQKSSHIRASPIR